MELYYKVTKELKIKMNPQDFDDVVYISQKFMEDCLADLIPPITS